MITDMQAGWAPAGRVRRPVALPRSLDRQIARLARAEDSTPSVLMAKALAEAMARWTNANGHRHIVEIESDESEERRVRRIVVLEPKLDRALEETLSTSDLDISELTQAAIKQRLALNGNGSHTNGAGNHE